MALKIVRVVTALFLLVIYAQAQVVGQEPLLKIDSQLVLLSVSVLDEQNRFVSGLSKEDFSVYESGVAQRLEFFSQDSAPVSLGIVIDTSGSMRFKLKGALQAAKALIGQCRAGDEVFILDMKDALQTHLRQPFTTDFELAARSLDRVAAAGGTALLDSVLRAGKYAHEEAVNRRKAILVLSDGDDRQSTMKVEWMVEQMRRYDLQVYLICFPDGYVNPDGTFLFPAPRNSRRLMKRIAEDSGGKVYFPASLSEVERIVSNIGEELRAQYTLGYEPTDDRDGWRALEVRLAPRLKRLSVRTRTGYFRKRE